MQIFLKILKLLFIQRFIKSEISKITNFINNSSNRIAIVGSSSRLLKKKYGKQIDKFDIVIRFNRAPTKKFEKHVGSKTTLRFLNQHTFEGVPYGKYVSQKDAKFVKKLKNSNLCVLLETNNIINKDKTHYTNKTNNVFFLNNNLNHYLRFAIVSDFNFVKKIQYYKYKPNFTTGMFVLSLMIILKKKISLFGFDKNKTNKNYGQYWKKTEINTVHDYDDESKILKKLIDNKKITFFD